MKIKGLLLPLLSLVATHANSAPMYQCEDETGNIQYTQTPSPHCVEVKPKPVQSISVPPSEKVQDNSSTEVDNRSEAPTPPKSQTIEEGCKIAVDTLQKIAGNFPLAKPDKNDPKKLVVLTKAEIEQERIKVQEYFDAVCQEKKSPPANPPQPNEPPVENESKNELKSENK